MKQLEEACGPNRRFLSKSATAQTQRDHSKTRQVSMRGVRGKRVSPTSSGTHEKRTGHTRNTTQTQAQHHSHRLNLTLLTFYLIFHR